MDPKEFPSLLLAWYDENGRELPWRRRGVYAKDPRASDPYAILLSEIMLQQTQVPRVIIKWQEWLQKFPTAKDVADASPRDVLLAWQGMGYNNRALRLKECCERVARDGWPTTPEGLDELPGIGRYTAHAIACFAFGAPVPIVDVNVKLVYAPFVGVGADDDAVWAFAQSILPAKRQYDYNQALFDIGTVVKSGDLSSLPVSLQKLYENIKSPKKESKEKLYAGFPLRLYRGVLVQLLRDSNDHSASIERIRTRFAQKLAKQPSSFILEVAKRLEKDGIVRVEGKQIRLA